MGKLLCGIDEIDPETGHEVFTDGPEGQVCIALFLDGGAVRAYLNVCPHMGRSLSFAPGEFLFGDRGELICPHHGACFDPAMGRCFSGPCEGDSLTAVGIELRDGQVLLDPESLRTPG